MSPKIEKGFYIAASLVAVFLSKCVAQAQNMPTASLAEQLRAQYKLANMGPQGNGVKVLEPGTVLVIQKGGIPTVPYTSTNLCSARYLDSKVDSPDALCPETARRNSRPLKVGEKVYPTQIEVDLKGEKISFHILACDSCNGTNTTASSKSEVVFQFAQGYLEKASVLEVEDTIGDVLAIDNSSATQVLQAATSQPEEADPNLLTNDKVVKMANAKLGDAVMVSMIKTSASSFDTNPNAVIKLKQAGVSDAVLQAMIEAGAQSNRSDSAEPTSDTAQGTTLSGLYYLRETGSQLQLNNDGSFSQRAADGRVSPGRFTVNGDTLALTYDATGRSSLFRIQGDKFYANTGLAWVRQGDAPAPADAPASASTQATFPVRHRHISLIGPGSDAIYYCSGDLSVSADGTVRYDCAQTDDPSGRCEHVSIPPGSLKQAKVGNNGLHLATNGRGNFDFVGDSGTINAALRAISPLTGTAPATSAATVAPPPTPAASSCGDYESCMKNGAASLEQPGGGTQALTEFQKASQLDPSKGEPWAGMAEAYLQMGQYGYVSAMWDRALQNGSILSISACHAGIACGDTGDFFVSVKEVSFVKKKGEKEFAVAPSAISSVESAAHGLASTFYWQFQVQGKKNYRFYYIPRGVQCKSNFICPEPGVTQQKVVADYLRNTLDRLRAGSFGSQASKP